jgi:hypothetical protein
VTSSGRRGGVLHLEVELKPEWQSLFGLRIGGHCVSLAGEGPLLQLPEALRPALALLLDPSLKCRLLLLNPLGALGQDPALGSVANRQVLPLSMVDNTVFSLSGFTILIAPAYASSIRRLSTPHLASSDDQYGSAVVLGPACVLPLTLSSAALAS